MSSPFVNHVIRIDQLFTGQWRIQMVEPDGTPIDAGSPATFPTRTDAWAAARTLASWFSVEVEEITKGQPEEETDE